MYTRYRKYEEEKKTHTQQSSIIIIIVINIFKVAWIARSTQV